MWEKLKGFAARVIKNVKLNVAKRSTWGILGVAALVAIVAWLLINVPQWQVQELWQYGDKDKPWETTRQMVELEAKHRAVLAQIIGGIVVLTGLYIAWRRVKATEDGQITERYTNAVQQLGDAKMEIRLGGIYALERIMKDSKADHWTIVEVLAAYVRKRAPWQPPKGEAHGPWRKYQANATTDTQGDIPAPAEDIQAVLTVLGRRPQKREEPGAVDLRATDLRGVDLQAAYLPKVNLWSAKLHKANLGSANLQEAELRSAKLHKAILGSANLHKAILVVANLQEANLGSANLQEANLGSANLQEANLGSANLHKAILGNANLQEANLGSANLHKADLGNANLQEANLWSAKLQEANLVSANLQEANLGSANLQEAELRYAKLQEANLRYANLHKAYLRYANLQEAFLRDANLQEAELRAANLQEAELWAANLQQAELRYADLRNSQELTTEQLLQVSSLYKAKLDPELEKQIRAQDSTLFEEPDPDQNVF